MTSRRPARVLLIGWEGADWGLIEPLAEAGLMPHLSRMTEEGVMGRLSSLVPTVCPVLWTSVATGVFGNNHDILSFVEPDGRGDVRPVQSTSRRRKAIWNMASQSGLRSAVVGWPATHPAEPINGVVVSDRFPQTSGATADLWPADRFTIHPPELHDDLMGLRTKVEDLAPDQVAAFVPGLAQAIRDKDPLVGSVASFLAGAASIQNAATWLAQKTEWDFMAVHYGQLGPLCHQFMKYHSAKVTGQGGKDVERFGRVVDTGYQLYDKMLGRLLDLAGPDTVTFLVSDHGFQMTPTRLGSEAIERQISALKSEPRFHYLRYHNRGAVICAAGPGVRKDELVAGGRLVDIVPATLAALGLPIPGDIDGRILDGVFEAGPEVAEIESYENPAPDDGLHHRDLVEDPWIVQELIENVSELGFAHLESGPAAALEVCSEQRDLNLADIHVALGRFEEALAVYQRVLTRDDSFAVRVPVIKCQISLKRFDEAAAEIESAAFMAPHSVVPDLLWATFHAARDDLQEAERCLDEAKGGGIPNVEVLMHLGAAAVRLGLWDKARTFFEGVLDTDPSSPGGHDGLGIALLHLGEVKKSVTHHLRSVQLLHRRSSGHLHLGEALVVAGRLDRAIQAFETAVALDPASHGAAARLAQALRERENRLRRAVRDAAEKPAGGDA